MGSLEQAGEVNIRPAARKLPPLTSALQPQNAFDSGYPPGSGGVYMSKPSIRFLVILGVILPAAIVFTTVNPSAQECASYSCNCPEAGKLFVLGPGMWEGTLDLVMKVQGGKPQLNIPLTFDLKGKLLLQVKDNEDFPSSAGGYCEYTLSGQGTQGAGTDNKGKSALLELDTDWQGYKNPPQSSEFTVRTKVSETSTLTMGGRRMARPDSGGELVMKFRVTEAACDTASGEFFAVQVDATANTFAGGGYTLLTPLSSPTYGHILGKWLVKQYRSGSDEGYIYADPTYDFVKSCRPD